MTKGTQERSFLAKTRHSRTGRDCAQVKRRCTLGEVPITQGIRANKTWGSGAESPGGNPYGPDRELFLCFLLFGPVAPIGRALDLHSSCCGFESHPVHKIIRGVREE